MFEDLFLDREVDIIYGFLWENSMASICRIWVETKHCIDTWRPWTDSWAMLRNTLSLWKDAINPWTNF